MNTTCITSWNGPHSGVVPALPSAGLAWGDKASPFALKWKPGPWEWKDVHWRFNTGDGANATAEGFNKAVADRGVMVIENLLHWDTWWDKRNHGPVIPEGLCDEGLNRTYELFCELRIVVRTSPTILTDLEDGLRHAKSHVVTALLNKAGFPMHSAANYAFAHGHPADGQVFAPGAMDGRTNFYNAYDRPGLTADGFAAMLESSGDAPLVVALSNRQTPELPKILQHIRKWKQHRHSLSVVIWNHAGEIDGECDRMIVQAINGPTPVKVRRSAKVTARRKAGS